MCCFMGGANEGQEVCHYRGGDQGGAIGDCCAHPETAGNMLRGKQLLEVIFELQALYTVRNYWTFFMAFFK